MINWHSPKRKIILQIIAIGVVFTFIPAQSSFARSHGKCQLGNAAITAGAVFATSVIASPAMSYSNDQLMAMGIGELNAAYQQSVNQLTQFTVGMLAAPALSYGLDRMGLDDPITNSMATGFATGLVSGGIGSSLQGKGFLSGAFSTGALTQGATWALAGGVSGALKEQGVNPVFANLAGTATGQLTGAGMGAAFNHQNPLTAIGKTFIDPQNLQHYISSAVHGGILEAAKNEPWADMAGSFAGRAIGTLSFEAMTGQPYNNVPWYGHALGGLASGAVSYGMNEWIKDQGRDNQFAALQAGLIGNLATSAAEGLVLGSLPTAEGSIGGNIWGNMHKRSYEGFKDVFTFGGTDRRYAPSNIRNIQRGMNMANFARSTYVRENSKGEDVYGYYYGRQLMNQIGSTFRSQAAENIGNAATVATTVAIDSLSWFPADYRPETILGTDGQTTNLPPRVVPDAQGQGYYKRYTDRAGTTHYIDAATNRRVYSEVPESYTGRPYGYTNLNPNTGRPTTSTVWRTRVAHVSDKGSRLEVNYPFQDIEVTEFDERGKPSSLTVHRPADWRTRSQSLLHPETLKLSVPGEFSLESLTSPPEQKYITIPVKGPGKKIGPRPYKPIPVYLDADQQLTPPIVFDPKLANEATLRWADKLTFETPARGIEPPGTGAPDFDKWSLDFQRRDPEKFAETTLKVYQELHGPQWQEQLQQAIPEFKLPVQQELERLLRHP